MFPGLNSKAIVSGLLLIGLIALFLVDACLPAYAFVMGSDDRQEINQAESQRPEIMQTGIIQIADGSFFTGVLMGDNCDVVISAGHAAIHLQSNEAKGWRRGQLRGGGKYQFNPGPGRNRAGPVAMVLVKSGLQNPADIDKDSSDWAVFRLAQPVSYACKNIRYVANGTSCNGHILMPGFHFDRRNVRLIDRSCKIKDSVGNALVVHDCDTKDGSSGAPLLCEDWTGLKLLAINISGLTLKDYVEPGVYGKASRNFDFRNHKNFAVTVHGEFLQALVEELEASRERKARRLSNAGDD